MFAFSGETKKAKDLNKSPSLFEDKEHGEWFGYLHYDGTPSHSLKGNIFKVPSTYRVC